VRDGASCLFWDDCWVSQLLKQAYPELFSFAKKSEISLKKVLAVAPTSELFNLPLSTQAFAQFQDLQEIMQNLIPSADFDSWFYIWGNSTFTSKQAYTLLMGSNLVHPIFSCTWKSSC
jgi:hypothetical protein